MVAGATGYTGRALVGALCRRDVRVVAHVRPDSAELERWRTRFGAMDVEVDVTAWEQEAMRDALVRLAPSVVFCLVGTTRKRAKAARARGDSPQVESYEAVDYGLTSLLVKACAELKPAPRFVYLSSLGADSTSRNAYLRARGKAEDAVRGSGLCYTIARPSFITGPDRDEFRPAERLGALMADGMLALGSLVGGRSMRQRYRSTDATTLADALVRLARDPDAGDRVVEGQGLRRQPA